MDYPFNFNEDRSCYNEPQRIGDTEEFQLLEHALKRLLDMQNDMKEIISQVSKLKLLNQNKIETDILNRIQEICENHMPKS